MRKLTPEEFKDRIEAVARARKIFIPHITKNVTVAFELYQKVFAEQQRSLFLSSIIEGKRPRTWLDEYERPRCPECNEPLHLRVIRVGKGKQNKKGWKTCWECLGETCYYEKYSRKSVRKQLKRLRRKKDA